MVNNLEIIEASELQIQQISKIWEELMKYHSNLNPFFTTNVNAKENVKNFLKDSILSKNSLLIVAIKDGKVVGYSNSRIDDYPPVFLLEKYGHILDMAVRSDHQRSGIGTKMLHENIRWFKTKNIKRIELRAVPTNPIGYNFWKKHGFIDYEHVLALEI